MGITQPNPADVKTVDVHKFPLVNHQFGRALGGSFELHDPELPVLPKKVFYYDLSHRRINKDGVGSYALRLGQGYDDNEIKLPSRAEVYLGGYKEEVCRVLVDTDPINFNNIRAVHVVTAGEKDVLVLEPNSKEWKKLVQADGPLTVKMGSHAGYGREKSLDVDKAHHFKFGNRPEEWAFTKGFPHDATELFFVQVPEQDLSK